MDGDTAEQGMIDILHASLQILRAHRNTEVSGNNGTSNFTQIVHTIDNIQRNLE